ncbi:MAG: SBBP repeat-containing protein [Candidatus Zixiibacteriota bacterium]
MTKKLFILAILLFITIPAFAQSVDTAWVRRYDGPGNSLDRAKAIAIDNSNNVYITGSSGTIKYDEDGNLLWIGLWGGVDLAIDAEENVYVGGKISVDDTSSDYVTVKYFPNGDTAWVRKYNGSGNGWDEITALALDSIGNICITGKSVGEETLYDCTTIKYDSSGNELWVMRYNGPGNDWDLSSDITVDYYGNIYVIGSSRGKDSGLDYVTIKYNSPGNEKWVKRYNGPGNDDDWAYAMTINSYEYVYVTGYSYSSETFNDYATIKYDSSGNEMWIRRYNGSGNSDDNARAIVLDGSGCIYVTGGSKGKDGRSEYATVKYDGAGNELWAKRYRGSAKYDANALAMAIDQLGNVYVTGGIVSNTTITDYTTVKYSSSGNELWIEEYNGPANNVDIAYAITLDDSGMVYVTGESAGGLIRIPEVGFVVNNDYTTIKYIQKKMDNR